MAEKTYALALVGQGIGASLTPGMHEAEARAQGFGLTYRRVELGDEGVTRLAELVEWARRFGLDGFNVTHPAKLAIIPLLDELSPLAARIQAVNTVVVREDGALVGHNTDALGFVRGLDVNLPGALQTRVLQVGVGGAGSAIAHSMLDRGVPHLSLFDVDVDRSRAVAADLAEHYGSDRVAAVTDIGEAIAGADGLVNATPIGMDHHPGTPVPVSLLRPDLWVADVIYSPINSELVLAARDLGCRTANGSGMAVHQAVEAFQIFTGHTADAGRMTRQFMASLEQRGF